MEKTSAAFQLDTYVIKEARINFKEIRTREIDVKFAPSGIFDREKGVYELSLAIVITDNTDTDTENENGLIYVLCSGSFSFENINGEIPDFFFRNSIAILFPYLRAFVSTITIQANLPALVLPTYNLSALENTLRENTKTI
jgi:preprotein translocase subunit SecB